MPPHLTQYEQSAIQSRMRCYKSKFVHDDNVRGFARAAVFAQDDNAF